MIKYTEATNRSYGYLFIDLKQNTPVGNIFNSVSANTRCSPNMVGSRVDEYINRDTREIRQFDDKPQRRILAILRKIIERLKRKCLLVVIVN